MAAQYAVDRAKLTSFSDREMSRRAGRKLILGRGLRKSGGEIDGARLDPGAGGLIIGVPQSAKERNYEIKDVWFGD